MKVASAPSTSSTSITSATALRIARTMYRSSTLMVRAPSQSANPIAHAVGEARTHHHPEGNQPPHRVRPPQPEESRDRAARDPHLAHGDEVDVEEEDHHREPDARV